MLIFFSLKRESSGCIYWLLTEKLTKQKVFHGFNTSSVFHWLSTCILVHGISVPFSASKNIFSNTAARRVMIYFCQSPLLCALKETAKTCIWTKGVSIDYRDTFVQRKDCASLFSYIWNILYLVGAHLWAEMSRNELIYSVIARKSR